MLRLLLLGWWNFSTLKRLLRVARRRTAFAKGACVFLRGATKLSWIESTSVLAVEARAALPRAAIAAGSLRRASRPCMP